MLCFLSFPFTRNSHTVFTKLYVNLKQHSSVCVLWFLLSIQQQITRRSLFYMHVCNFTRTKKLDQKQAKITLRENSISVSNLILWLGDIILTMKQNWKQGPCFEEIRKCTLNGWQKFNNKNVLMPTYNYKKIHIAYLATCEMNIQACDMTPVPVLSFFTLIFSLFTLDTKILCRYSPRLLQNACVLKYLLIYSAYLPFPLIIVFALVCVGFQSKMYLFSKFYLVLIIISFSSRKLQDPQKHDPRFHPSFFFPFPQQHSTI